MPNLSYFLTRIPLSKGSIMQSDRSDLSQNGPIASRHRMGRPTRCAVALGATVASILGTLVVASGPALAATSVSSIVTSVTAPVVDVANTTAGTAACPAGLPAPTTEGGIGNLYPLIPFFGPFSSEAFVWLPLLQTLVPSFAPLLPSAQTALVAIQPEINVLLAIVEELEASGYAVIGPQYAPYRQQVLNAEQQLVDILLPLAQEGTTLPGSACLPDVEGIIVTYLDETATEGNLG
jgi:hypothetical protein